MTSQTATPEPLSIQSQDTTTSLLSEQDELLEMAFGTALKAIDALIELYEVDPDAVTAREDYTRLLQTLRKGQLPLATQLSKLQQLDKAFQRAYLTKLEAMASLNDKSYSQVSKNSKVLFEQRMKTVEVHSLEKTLGQLKPIELSDQALELSLSKEQVMKILEVEKRKRAALSFQNEQVLEPEIKKLTQEYESWGKRDMELKRYLVDDLEAMGRKVSQVKRLL